MAGVNVRIGADASQFDSEVARVRRQVGQLGSELREGVTTFAQWGTAAAAAGTAMTGALVKRGVEAVTQQQRLARSLQVTNKEMAGLTAAFKNFQLQNDDVADALGTLSDRADEAMSGTKSMAEDFTRIGIEIDDLRGKRPDELFRLLSERISQTEDPTKRTAAAVRIFGDEIGRRLLPLLMQGPEGLNRFREQADRLGLALTRIESRQVEDAAESMEQMQMAFDGVSQQLAVQFAPLIQEANRQFQDLVDSAGGIDEVTEQAFNNVIDGAAFVVDAVEGIERTFLVAGKSAAAFALQVQLAAAKATKAVAGSQEDAEGWTDTIMNGLLSIGRTTLESVGMSTDGAAKNMDEFRDAAGNSVKELQEAVDTAMQDIQNTLLAPMPSSAFENFVNKSRKAAEKAAQQTRSTGADGPALGEVIPVGQGIEAPSDDEIQERMEKLREANMSEMEVLKEKQQQEQELLMQANERKLEIEGGFESRMEQMKSRHEEEMTKLNQKSLQAREATMGQILGNMSTLMNTESRKMFEIGKTAAIAQSIISTYQGASKALELGWPLGPIAAAAITAKGFAQVASIRSQSFSSGGGGGSGSGSATQNINDDSTPVQSGGGQQGGGASGPTTMINLQGDTFGRDQVADLLDRINEEKRDGGRILIN